MLKSFRFSKGQVAIEFIFMFVIFVGVLSLIVLNIQKIHDDAEEFKDSIRTLSKVDTIATAVETAYNDPAFLIARVPVDVGSSEYYVTVENGKAKVRDARTTLEVRDIPPLKAFLRDNKGDYAEYDE